MQIGKISLHTAKVAKETPKEQDISQKVNSNPFGVSFKGNVIQADVFQKSTKNIAAGAKEKGKLFASAVVSGINNFNEAFKSRINSIASFGKKVISDVREFGKKEIKIDLEGIKNRLFPNREYSVKNLTNKPVDEIRTMWSNVTA